MHSFQTWSCFLTVHGGRDVNAARGGLQRRTPGETQLWRESKLRFLGCDCTGLRSLRLMENFLGLSYDSHATIVSAGLTSHPIGMGMNIAIG